MLCIHVAMSGDKRLIDEAKDVVESGASLMERYVPLAPATALATNDSESIAILRLAAWGASFSDAGGHVVGEFDFPDGTSTADIEFYADEPMLTGLLKLALRFQFTMRVVYYDPYDDEIPSSGRRAGWALLDGRVERRVLQHRSFDPSSIMPSESAIAAGDDFDSDELRFALERFLHEISKLAQGLVGH